MKFVMRCLNPLQIPNPRYSEELGVPPKLTIPCGKCPACLWNKREEWALRCLLESRKAPYNNYFFCLTYAQLYLPLVEDDETSCILPTFSSDDLRRFTKNLSRLSSQYNCSSTPRYIITSEYSPSWRPHYHGILFNFNGKDVQSYLEQAWSRDNHPLGGVDVGPLEDGGARYCFKYLFKQVDDVRLSSPLFRCSKKPAIGRDAMSVNLKEYIHERNRKIFPVKGSFTKLPRILSSEVFTDEELARIGEIQSSEMEIQSKSRFIALLNEGLSPEEANRIQRDERRKAWYSIQRKIKNSCQHSKDKIK